MGTCSAVRHVPVKSATRLPHSEGRRPYGIRYRPVVDLESLNNPDFSRIAEAGTPRLKRILADSAQDAASREHDFVGVEHVFLAMLADGGSVPVQLLGRHLDLDAFRAELSSFLDGYDRSR
jgi:hypothetical protein